jgi:hypothetical protein
MLNCSKFVNSKFAHWDMIDLLECEGQNVWWMSQGRKTTITIIKSRTRQGKQIIRNGNLNLIQD